MKAKIFSFVKVTPESMIASNRIARFVAEQLNLDIVSDESIAQESLDVLVIVNGAYAFAGSSLLEALGEAIENAGRIVWIQNDYTIIPPKDIGNAKSPFRQAFVTRFHNRQKPTVYWTTVHDLCSRSGKSRTGHILAPESRYINWNCLTWDDGAVRVPMSMRISANDIVYYGSFRKDRRNLFDRYFNEPEASTFISCPNNKFRDVYTNELITHWPKFDRLHDSLAHFGLGLYLEDKRSSKEFHSPANRFYEMLSSGVGIAFPPESVRMMKEAGYEIGEWMAFDAADLVGMLEKKEDIYNDQINRLRHFAASERLMLSYEVQKAWKALTE